GGRRSPSSRARRPAAPAARTGGAANSAGVAVSSWRTLLAGAGRGGGRKRPRRGRPSPLSRGFSPLPPGGGGRGGGGGRSPRGAFPLTPNPSPPRGEGRKKEVALGDNFSKGAGNRGGAALHCAPRARRGSAARAQGVAPRSRLMRRAFLFALALSVG